MSKILNTKEAILEIIKKRNINIEEAKGKISLQSGFIFDYIDANTSNNDDKSSKILHATQEVLNKGFLKKHNAKIKIFSFTIKYLFLTFILFCTYGILFLKFSSMSYNENIENISREVITSSSHAYNVIVENELNFLSRTSKVILNINNIRDAFFTRNKEKLGYSISHISNDYKLDTNLYSIFFVGDNNLNSDNVEPNNKVFFRLPDSNTSGDVFTSNAFENVRKNKIIFDNKELNKTGVILNHISPFYYNNKLTGYLVLSEDIRNILTKMKEITNSDYAVLIDKKYINEQEWLRLPKNLNKNWDKDKNFVITDQTFEFDIPGNFDNIPETSGFLGEITNNGSVYSKGFFPIYDSNSSQIGIIIVISDISKYNNTYTSIRNKVIIMLLVLSIIIFLAITYLLRKYIKIINRIYKSIEGMEKFLGGDHNMAFDTKSSDEFSEVEKTFEQIKNILKKITTYRYP